MYRLVFTGIYCTWYLPVYTSIYSDILLCAGFRGAHRDAMMPEPSTAPEPEGWDPEEEDHRPCPLSQDHGDEEFSAGPDAARMTCRMSWGEEACRKRCTAQAGSQDKTGSQDGLSLIPSKGWYISVCTKLSVVYTGIYSYVISLHT